MFAPGVIGNQHMGRENVLSLSKTPGAGMYALHSVDRFNYVLDFIQVKVIVELGSVTAP